MPFCQVHCPLQNNIPDWLKLTAEGRLEEAYELSQATNNMPEICGRICPQDRLCEGNCVIEQSGHGTVTIGAVEKYITDTAWERRLGQADQAARANSAASIGIIGAGPAGLAAAEQLRAQGLRGHDLRSPRPRRRFADLRHPELQAREARSSSAARKRLVDGGVEFELNIEVGKTITLAELRAQHDAVLIATGVYKARDMQAPGVGLAGIVPALRYLTASNRVGLGDEVQGVRQRHAERARAATSSSSAAATRRWIACAPPCAKARSPSPASIAATAKTCRARCAKSATPRKKASCSPGSPRRKRFCGDKRVTGVRAMRMRLGAADATGRQVAGRNRGQRLHARRPTW